MGDDHSRDSLSVDLIVLDTKVRLAAVGDGAPAFLDAVRQAWSRCLRSDADAPDVTLTVGFEPGAPGLDVVDPDPDRLLHHLSPLVTVRAIDHQAGRLLMLHAAGLARPGDGRTIALVAPSGTGKTTAAARLGRDLGYLTDETVGIRADGSIAPYPKPLSLVVPDAGTVKQQVSPDDLDLATAPADAHLAAIALLARDGSDEAWVEEVPLLTSLARLGPESSYLARLDRPLHRLAGAVEDAGGLLVFHYADSAQLPGLVEAALAAAA